MPVITLQLGHQRYTVELNHFPGDETYFQDPRHLASLEKELFALLKAKVLEEKQDLADIQRFRIAFDYQETGGRFRITATALDILFSKKGSSTPPIAKNSLPLATLGKGLSEAATELIKASQEEKQALTERKEKYPALNNLEHLFTLSDSIETCFKNLIEAQKKQPHTNLQISMIDRGDATKIYETFVTMTMGEAADILTEWLDKTKKITDELVNIALEKLLSIGPDACRQSNWTNIDFKSDIRTPQDLLTRLEARLAKLKVPFPAEILPRSLREVTVTQEEYTSFFPAKIKNNKASFKIGQIVEEGVAASPTVIHLDRPWHEGEVVVEHKFKELFDAKEGPTIQDSHGKKYTTTQVKAFDELPPEQLILPIACQKPKDDTLYPTPLLIPDVNEPLFIPTKQEGKLIYLEYELESFIVVEGDNKSSAKTSSFTLKDGKWVFEDKTYTPREIQEMFFAGTISTSPAQPVLLSYRKKRKSS